MIAKRPLSLMVILVFLLSAFCLLPSALGQSATATLSGEVTDQNGAVVPGANITMLNTGTSLKRQTTTNDSGNFTIPLLPPGTYTVAALRDGFSPVEIRDVVLNVGDQKALKIELKAGDINAQVQVVNEATLINESPAVGTVIDRQFLSNLPLSGRSFQSLILLTPGIVATPSDGIRPGEFSVNGQRQNANYFTVDGVSANTGVNASGTDPAQFSQQAGGAIPGTTALGTTASLVSIDALEEFKIQASTYSAEYGRQPGAQVQLVTRSGTNDFHGTAFDYVRNEIFDANDWFANSEGLERAPLRQNQFGGIFSGPVMLPHFGEGGKPYWSGRNRTFFFFSYEGQRLRLPNSVETKVPSLRLRQAAAPAVQPFLNAFPLPTGPETTTAVGQPSGSAPFATAYSSPASVDAYSIRLDHAVNSKLSLFGRYSYTPSNSLNRFLNQLTGTVQKARTLTLGTTLVVTPQLNNEFRFNYSSNRGRKNFSMDNFGGAVPPTLSQFTLGHSGPGPKQGTFFFFLPGASFVSELGDNVDNATRQLNIVDNLSWVKGAHQLKFGVDWRRLNTTYAPFAFLSQAFFFSEASIVSSRSDFLLLGSRKGARPIYYNFSAYAQDTWKLSPRLTLDLGLRWEINPAPHDANGLRPVVLTGINGTDVSNVSIAPPNALFYKTFKTAFAPRVGITYALNQTSGRETVLRGGFGVYYDLGSGMASSLFGGYPFASFAFLSGQSLPIPPELVQPPAYPPVPTQLPIPDTDFNALDPNLKLPYTLQWNVALQQSLGKQQTVSLSYVASAARRLIIFPVLNVVDPLTNTRPNSNIGEIQYATNGPTADYRSLQVQYQRRLSRGLQALGSYTWSHATDTASTDVAGFASARGNSDFDVRHNFSAAVTYDLPKVSGAGHFVQAIVNGWSVDSVFFARTGTPIDLVAQRNPVINGGLRLSRPDVVPGVPFWIKDPSVAGGQRLNPAAFALPPTTLGVPFYYPSRQGTLARNAVYLPGIYQLNMAVRRQFSLGERLNLQLKAEAFNVLNHPLFGCYNQSVGSVEFPSPDFGKPVCMLSRSMGGLNSLYQLGGPRSMQFSVRLSF